MEESSLLHAHQQAVQWIVQQVQAQALFLAYMDAFWLLMLISLATIPLALNLRKKARRLAVASIKPLGVFLTSGSLAVHLAFGSSSIGLMRRHAAPPKPTSATEPARQNYSRHGPLASQELLLERSILALQAGSWT